MMQVGGLEGAAQVLTGGSLSRKLAKHLAQKQYRDLPPAALEAAKRYMLDSLAVAWAGSDAPGCVGVHRVLIAQGGAGESSVWARGGRLPLTSAAFLNSTFAAALDFDSMGRSVPTHINIVVLPAALAAAERAHANGKDFLTALVLGCDLMHRIGASSQALGQPHKGWFYTSIHGGFGSAAACGKLLGLDDAAMAHALGIAFSQAAGTQQANIEPSLTKRLQSAFAARAGVFAALLAREGVTAPQEVFEGQYGLYRMYQEGSVERLLDGLGERYENDELSIKKYPSCGGNHTAIEAALRIAVDHNLDTQHIERIEVEISPFMNRLVGGTFDPSADPQAAAQFNIRYSIACAMLRRKFGLAELETEAIRDPHVARLVQRIEVVVDPTNTGSRGPAVLRVRTRSHGEIVRRVEHEPGSLEAPLTDAEIADKCRQCFARGARPLSAGESELLMERIARVEQISDMALFFDGLS
jgi:2-methylcitrate dehydratase PrpD